eukprot:UN27209
MLHICIFHSKLCSSANRLSKEVVFLDSHTLNDLRGCIDCLAKTDEKAGYFVIEGICYTDNNPQNRLDSHKFITKSRKDFKRLDFYRHHSINKKL